MRMGDERSLQRLWDLHNLLSGEWISDIMVALSSGPLRRAELLDTVRGTTIYNGWSNSSTRNLSDKVLQNTLQRMEKSELVEHTRDESEFPVKSWYRLTPAGVGLLHALEAPVQWAERHDDLITRVQKRRGGYRA